MAKKMQRIYRLRDTLAHAEACDEWQAFVRGFETADEVLEAVNANPGRLFNGAYEVAWSVRWFGRELACALSSDCYNDAEWRWWEQQRLLNQAKPITREERDRFVEIWKLYADRHGLYAEVRS